jgi:peptidoglycan/LPS O-acetylase OafA/YrhL
VIASVAPDTIPARLAEKASIRHDNSFDIVRLTLAMIVVVFHCAELSQSSTLAWLPRYFYGPLAVEGFFAISGFLIFASYERCASLGEYCAKRAWRILPAYWLATVLCVVIAFTSGSYHVGKFLLGNLSFLTFLHPSVAGVFAANPQSEMNGALWTIKIEVMFYAAVPIIVWLCRRLQRDAVLWALFAASIAYRVLLHPAHEKLAIQLPGQLSYFMIGALVHYHLPFFMKYGRWLMLAAACCYGAHYWSGWYFPRPAAIAVLTLGFALLLPPVKGPTRWGDFSYGTYVLHWPIIQMVVAAGLYRAHPWPAFVVSVALVEVGAIFSWFVVEKPALAHAHARSNSRKAAQPAIIVN